MDKADSSFWDWEGSCLSVKILFSSAGIATQILVCDKEDDSTLLMDVGDGTLRDLLALPEKYYQNIKGILITHGHFDHVGGLFTLLGFFRMINRTKKMTIISPRNNIELEGMIDLFEGSYQETIPYKIERTNIKGKIPIEISKKKIFAFPVKHRGSTGTNEELPEIPAVGFRIEKEKDTIVFTGDTGYFEELAEQIKDVDLAIIEGTYEEKTTDYHLTTKQAEKLGKLAKEYVVIHKIRKQL